MKASLGVGQAAVRAAMAILLGLLGLGSMIAPGVATAAAQKSGLVDDNTYISEFSGEEITWGRDWEIDEDNTAASPDIERISLIGTSGLLDVIYAQAGLDLVGARDGLLDLLLGDFDDSLQVDRGDYQGSSGKVSYSLDKVLLGDTEFAMFTLLMERRNDTFITVFYSTPELFADGMASAQDSIEIDGSAIFQGIKPAGMADALDAAPSLLDGADSTSKKSSTSDRGSTSDRTSGTEDETETPEADATEEDSSSRTSTSKKTDETATEEATEEDSSGRSSSSKKTDETATEEDSDSRSSGSKKTSTGSADDYADLGVISEGEYESPQYGASVEWSDAWMIDEDAKNPVLSDTDTATDQISFVRAEYTDSGDSASYGSLSVRFFEAGSGDTPQSVVDYWTSDDYLNGGAGDGSTVLLSDATKSEGSAVLISTLDNGGTLVQYLSVFFLDRGKTAVMIEFYSTDESIADAYADAADGITVDGQPILTLFDDRDIEDALDAQ